MRHNSSQHTDGEKQSNQDSSSQQQNGNSKTRNRKKLVVKVPKVSSEESLIVVLKMVKAEMRDGKFNASRRRILMTFLENVDFKAINLM